MITEEVDESQGVVRQYLREVEPFITTSSYLALSTALYEQFEKVKEAVQNVEVV